MTDSDANMDPGGDFEKLFEEFTESLNAAPEPRTRIFKRPRKDGVSTSKDVWLSPREPLVFGWAGMEMSGSMSSETGVFEHEIGHRTPIKDYPAPGAGKTSIAKDLSKYFNKKSIIHIDASDYRSPEDLDRLIGAPPGYLDHPGRENKLKLTAEQQKSLSDVFAQIGEEMARDGSRRNGEQLAAACHDGVAAPTAAMKPLRFRGGAGATFAVTGGSWA